MTTSGGHATDFKVIKGFLHVGHRHQPEQPLSFSGRPTDPRLPATLQLNIVHIVGTRDKSSAAKSDVDPASLESHDTSRRRRRAGLFNRGRQPEPKATLSDNFFKGRGQSRSAPATPLFISNKTSASMRQAL